MGEYWQLRLCLWLVHCPPLVQTPHLQNTHLLIRCLPEAETVHRYLLLQHEQWCKVLVKYMNLFSRMSLLYPCLTISRLTVGTGCPEWNSRNSVLDCFSSSNSYFTELLRGWVSIFKEVVRGGTQTSCRALESASITTSFVVIWSWQPSAVALSRC